MAPKYFFLNMHPKPFNYWFLKKHYTTANNFAGYKRVRVPIGFNYINIIRNIKQIIFKNKI